MSSYMCSPCPRSIHVAKRSRQEKATLRWRSATRTAHAASTEIGKRPKLASLRQRTLLYPISALATCRHLTGFNCNGNFKSNGNRNRNCRYAERQGQPQRQLSLRGTSSATAPVAAQTLRNLVMPPTRLSHN